MFERGCYGEPYPLAGIGAGGDRVGAWEVNKKVCHDDGDGLLRVEII